MTIKINALADEINTDPLGRGYSGMTDQEVADSLNNENRPRARISISGDEVFNRTDTIEFQGLTDHKQQLWLAFCGRSGIDPFAIANVAFVKWIFGDASITVSNLSDYRTYNISRAVELGLLGSSMEVGPAHVNEARRL